MTEEPLNATAPALQSTQTPEISQTPPVPPDEHLIPPPPDSPLTASARRFPPVTVTDWPEPEDDLPDPEFDGLEIPEEDASRDPEDLYACVQDDEDDSKAAQQFADWSDPDFLEFLRREVGDFIDEDIQSICKLCPISTSKMLNGILLIYFSQASNYYGRHQCDQASLC